MPCPWDVERENMLWAFHEYLDKGPTSPCMQELGLIKSAGVTDHLVEWYWTMKQLTGKFYGVSSNQSHEWSANIQQIDRMAMTILRLTSKKAS